MLTSFWGKMDLITIVLFILYLWCIGFTINKFFGEPSEFFERNIMRLAFGTAGITVLLTLFTILRVVIDWKLVLLVSVIYPAYFMIKQGIRMPKIKLTKTNLCLFFVLILFLFTFHMYHKGSFGYDYFEDGDPWIHAAAAKYIALEKTTLDPGKETFQYIDPYPPAYDALMAILYQTSGDLMWTFKFFNSLLLSLGILFFFYMAKKFLGDPYKALFATFILTMIPSYMSHFIWSHTLVVLLIFPLFYSLEHINKENKWHYITAICYAGIMLAQPTQSFKITLMLGIYFIIKSLYGGFATKEFLAGLYGGVASLVVWWGPMWIKYKETGLVKALGSGGSKKGAEGFTLKYWGTADRVYNFNDFFYAKAQNMINNPIGIGVVICLLVGITLIWVIWKNKKLFEQKYRLFVTSFAILLFTFAGVHGVRLPVQLWAFRFWMLQAIFISLVVPEGMWALKNILKKIRVPAFVIILIVVAGVFFTSGSQKYAVNTSQWGPTASLMQFGQLESWMYIKDMPKDTKIYYPCEHGMVDYAILSYDKYMCVWCQEDMDRKNRFFNISLNENYDWLNSKDYKYLYIDGNCVQQVGENKTNELAQQALTSGKFLVEKQTTGAILMKVS